MWALIWFYAGYALLYYLPIRNKQIVKRDFIIYNLFMLIVLFVFSLYFSGVPFPYLATVIEELTKPLSDPLKDWLNHFQTS